MTAVIRLKRHLADEPISALIINCKKRKKTENSDENKVEVSTLLTFAGTVNNQDEDISPHISKLSKEELEKSFKKHVPNITSKIKQQTTNASKESRFKVVNYHRSIENSLDSVKDSSKPINKLPLTVLDVETEKSDNATNQTNLINESDYVYDLYYTNCKEIDESEIINDFEICLAQEIIFDEGAFDDSDHDTDDSNDENNWRNDYPDEDDFSIDEDDIRKAMDCLGISDSDSSVDCADGFIYSVDSEAVGFEEDLDHSDGRRYGELYARFKMRQKREEESYNKDLYDNDDDTDNYSD